jgi:ribonuclease BN (tRNA processing enzyme)
MKLLLLGTTGYHPNDERQTACLMLPEAGIVLDAGTAMYRVRDYLATRELDIFITHAHLDHVVGLTFLFDVVQGKELSRVTVHGSQEHLEAVRRNLFNTAIFPVDPPCSFSPLVAPTVVLHSGGRLTHFPLPHPGGSLGYRLDWPGHSLAYVTDTTAAPGASYIDQLRGVDLLIHECYFADDRAAWAAETGHSATTAVAQVAHQAGVGRLVLVHINPLATETDPIGLDIARAIFANTEIGHDRMVLNF